MNERDTISPSPDSAVPETPGTQVFSFIVRIWKNGGTAKSECRGWVEHVQSRQQTSFLGLEQLLAVIASYVGVPVRWGQRGRNRLTESWARVAGWLAQLRAKGRTANDPTHGR